MTLNKHLGPPAPFAKMLMAMLGCFILTYLEAMTIGQSWIDLLGNVAMLGIFGILMMAILVLLAWASIDFFRQAPRREKMRAAATLVLGYFAFDAMQQLARLPDKATYLATFVGALSAVLLAIAIEGRPATRKLQEASDAQ